MWNSWFDFNNDDFDYIVENFFTDKNDMIPIIKEILNKNKKENNKKSMNKNNLEVWQLKEVKPINNNSDTETKLNKKILKKVELLKKIIKEKSWEYEIRSRSWKVILYIDNNWFLPEILVWWNKEIEIDNLLEELRKEWLLEDFIERIKYNTEEENGNINKLLKPTI